MAGDCGSDVERGSAEPESYPSEAADWRRFLEAMEGDAMMELSICSRDPPVLDGELPASRGAGAGSLQGTDESEDGDNWGRSGMEARRGFLFAITVGWDISGLQDESNGNISATFASIRRESGTMLGMSPQIEEGELGLECARRPRSVVDAAL